MAKDTKAELIKAANTINPQWWAQNGGGSFGFRRLIDQMLALGHRNQGWHANERGAKRQQASEDQ